MTTRVIIAPSGNKAVSVALRNGFPGDPAVMKPGEFREFWISGPEELVVTEVGEFLP